MTKWSLCPRVPLCGSFLPDFGSKLGQTIYRALIKMDGPWKPDCLVSCFFHTHKKNSETSNRSNDQLPQSKCLQRWHRLAILVPGLGTNRLPTYDPLTLDEMRREKKGGDFFGVFWTKYEQNLRFKLKQVAWKKKSFEKYDSSHHYQHLQRSAKIGPIKPWGMVNWDPLGTILALLWRCWYMTIWRYKDGDLHSFTNYVEIKHTFCSWQFCWVPVSCCLGIKVHRIVVRSRIEKLSRRYPSMDFSDCCKGGR